MKYYFSACTGNVHRNVETFLSFLLESRMECQRYCFDKNKKREEKVPVIVHEGHLCLVFARVFLVFAAAHTIPTHELAERTEKKKNSQAHNHDIATHIFESN